jgi:muramoyltetrapeptide carboxypeptidase LdcA involved in peptidoglycan recycling
MDFPILMNFPSGHIPKTLTLPLGTLVEMRTRDKSVTFLESPFVK